MAIGKDTAATMRNLGSDDDGDTRLTADWVFDTEPLARIMRGHRDMLHLREYNRGRGNWDMYCNSAAALTELVHPECTRFIRSTVECIACDCLTLPPDHCTRFQALNANMNVDTLISIDFAALTAWCIITHEAGCGWMDCEMVYRDLPRVGKVIREIYKGLDKLTETPYNSKRLGLLWATLNNQKSEENYD